MKTKTLEAFQAYKNTGVAPSKAPAQPVKKSKWICKVCGYVYNGDIPFEELPADWTCPVCKHPKSDFEEL
jgi:rubredoxin